MKLLKAVCLVGLLVVLCKTAFAAEKPALEIGYGAYASKDQGSGPVISVKVDIPRTKLNLLYMHVDGLGKTDKYTMLWWNGDDNSVPGQAWFITKSKFDFVGIGKNWNSSRLTYGVNAGPTWISQTFHSKVRTPDGEIFNGFLTVREDVTRVGAHINAGYKLTNTWLASTGYTWPGRSELQGFDVQIIGQKAF